MSFFEDASLVLIPSGIKNQKIYSVKPTDGTGDLTFSRASSATRVASNGLIEKVRTNLQTYSQNFTAAGGWGGDPITATANYGTAPDGTQTSTRLVFSSANHVWQQSVTGINGNLGVFSLYIKGTAGQTIQIAYGGTDKLVTIGTGWTRVNTNGTIASTGTININTYGGNARDFEVWGGQTELGDIATAYIATTTAAVSVGPVSGLPRLDYLGSTCPRLLLEPQRTNLALYSEQFDNAAWTKSNATVTANTSVSPDGYTNADTVVITTGGYLYREVTSYSAVSGQSASISVFAKNQTNNFLIFGGATPAGIDVYKIENYGNGWYRHSVVRTFTTTTTGTLQYLVAYEIVGTHIVWGAQIEGSNSAYATSYIPTLGTSVTRVADAASKTGISSLIGQTEGTIFGELKITAYDPNGFIPVYLKNSAGSNEVYVWFQTDGRIRGRVYNASAAQADIFTAAGFATVGGTYKFALAYKQNDFAFYVNGQQIGTDTSGTVGATSEFYFTYAQLADFSFPLNINQALIFPTRLTNAQLAELTTL
jgi:hypothetical protein